MNGGGGEKEAKKQSASDAWFPIGLPRSGWFHDTNPCANCPIYYMKKLTCALVLAVFGSCSWLAWATLGLLLQVKNGGRVLPQFTGACISLRPVLIALPCAATGYYLWLWLRKEEKASHWTGLVVSSMVALLVFVLPAISTSYLVMIDQVKLAIGVP